MSRKQNEVRSTRRSSSPGAVNGQRSQRTLSTQTMCVLPSTRPTQSRLYIANFQSLQKTKDGFANENSLVILLYAGILKASERWTHPVQNLNLTLSQLAIHFEGGLDKHLAL